MGAPRPKNAPAKMKPAGKFKTLSADRLKWTCRLDRYPITSTRQGRLIPDIIGQPRGVKALKLGLDIDSRGYNIFVAGLSGTGRKTAVQTLLKNTERYRRIPDDKLYVYNFENPDTPLLIRLPAGQGKRFQKDMEEFINFLISNIASVFEGEEYVTKKKEIVNHFQDQQRALIKKFEKQISKEGLALTQTQMGPIVRPSLLPLFKGKPINFEQLSLLKNKGELTEDQVNRMEEKVKKYSEKMVEIFKKIRSLERKAQEKMKKLDIEMITPLVDLQLQEIKERYASPRIEEYLDNVKESVRDNLGRFQKKESQQTPQNRLQNMISKDPFIDYRVNLLVDNDRLKHAPVIFETSPKYNNLFGTIEITPEKFGQILTDFTRVKAGSLLKADGGFLIVDALDLLMEPGVWDGLKRVLKNGRIEIQVLSSIYSLSVTAMKPEPIRCDVKVVIVGDPFIYHLLYAQDQEFKKIFKLRADFDSEMKITLPAVRDYANFSTRIVKDEGLLHLTQKAVGVILEYGVRMAGRQNRLSTQFNRVADIIREADYWAKKDGKKSITPEYVRRAVDEKQDRKRLVEEKIQERIQDKSILIATEGRCIGQVNGLSVHDMGDYAFGRPSRITATVSVGNAGIINIEREAQLSGRIHHKGVLILSGFLRHRFAQNKPLILSASICFEQSYSGVEGDSASSTEIYVLLSSLADIPLRQDIAVTGSVNQHGEIQPIGGVNEKIEGFFEVCRLVGFTGTQGVIIPHQNSSDLNLHREVIDEVKKGRFHIYPIRRIEEGIEILTGYKAGIIRADGTYPAGTVFARADQKLNRFAGLYRNYIGRDSLSGGGGNE